MFLCQDEVECMCESKINEIVADFLAFIVKHNKDDWVLVAFSTLDERQIIHNIDYIWVSCKFEKLKLEVGNVPCSYVVTGNYSPKSHVHENPKGWYNQRLSSAVILSSNCTVWRAQSSRKGVGKIKCCSPERLEFGTRKYTNVKLFQWIYLQFFLCNCELQMEICNATAVVGKWWRVTICFVAAVCIGANLEDRDTLCHVVVYTAAAVRFLRITS